MAMGLLLKNTAFSQQKIKWLQLLNRPKVYGEGRLGKRKRKHMYVPTLHQYLCIVI